MIKNDVRTDKYGQNVLDLCISSRCRILNGRTLGDTRGHSTSFQPNGNAAVDYALVSTDLLKNVSWFKVDSLTYHSDHCQISICLKLNYNICKFKTQRLAPISIRWSTGLSRNFSIAIASKSTSEQASFFYKVIQSIPILPRKRLLKYTKTLPSRKDSVNKLYAKKKCLRKCNKKWFDKDCSTLRRSLREMARRVSRNQNDKEFLKHFYSQKKQYKTLLRKKERKYKARTVQSLLDIETKLSPVKRICVFEHSVMTNFNCACPAIQRGQGPGFLSEGSS